jgi:hypothetical protein
MGRRKKIFRWTRRGISGIAIGRECCGWRCCVNRFLLMHLLGSRYVGGACGCLVLKKWAVFVWWGRHQHRAPQRARSFLITPIPRPAPRT